MCTITLCVNKLLLQPLCSVVNSDVLYFVLTFFIYLNLEVIQYLVVPLQISVISSADVWL